MNVPYYHTCYRDSAYCLITISTRKIHCAEEIGSVTEVLPSFCLLSL
jgi:hypothetical protein